MVTNKNFVDMYALCCMGVSIIPIVDGEKTPVASLLPGWKWEAYSQRVATEEEVALWAANTGSFAIVSGSVSGNLEVLDFDDYHLPGTYEKWQSLLSEEALSVFRTLPVVATRNKGFHVRYRLATEVGGNKKLYEAPDAITGKKSAIIETRGQGGYALIPPSQGYSVVQGDLLHIPVIPGEVHEEFFSVAKSFNPLPEDITTTFPHAPVDAQDRPGDAFAAKMDWESILGPHGWQKGNFDVDGKSYWRRPGKQKGFSATTGNAGHDTLYVFSSNADPFENDRGYGKFHAYALLNHDGNYKAAAKALADLGFGEKTVPSPVSEDPIEKAVVLPAWEVANRQSLDSSIKFSTGMAIFDEALLGGFSLGNLVVAAGRSGVGKTTLIQNWTVTMAMNNVPSLWFTYEVLAKALWGKFIDMGCSEKSPIFLPSYNESGDIEWVIDMIDEAIRKYNTKFIGIDHIGFLSPPKGHQYANNADAITHTVRKLKRYAVKAEVMIALPVHVRKTQNKALDLDDVKDSVGIVQEADAVFFIDRLRDDNGLYKDQSVVRLQKNRETGVSSLAVFNFDGNKFFFNGEETRRYEDADAMPAKAKKEWDLIGQPVTSCEVVEDSRNPSVPTVSEDPLDKEVDKLVSEGRW